MSADRSEQHDAAFAEIVREQNRKWDAAINNKNPQQLASIVTDDFVYVESGRPPVRGPAAMVALAEEWIAAGIHDEVLTTIECRCSFESGHQLASFTVKAPDENGGVGMLKGHFVDVFRLCKDGVWRRCLQIVTVDP